MLAEWLGWVAIFFFVNGLYSIVAMMKLAASRKIIKQEIMYGEGNIAIMNQATELGKIGRILFWVVGFSSLGLIATALTYSAI